MRRSAEQPVPCTQVKGDVRLIKSANFATAYSLRFPRVTRVRFGDDKGPQHTMTHQELLEDVEKKRISGTRNIRVEVARTTPQEASETMLCVLLHTVPHAPPSQSVKSHWSARLPSFD